LSPRQTVDPNTPFIASLHDGTWAENMVGVITDEKEIKHLYHLNTRFKPVKNPPKMLVCTTDNAFHFNMLENEVEVIGIFGIEVAMLWSRPHSLSGAGPLSTQVMWAMIRDAVQCLGTPEWCSQFEAMLLKYSDVIRESKTDLSCSD
jgi:hypothetical protein